MKVRCLAACLAVCLLWLNAANALAPHQAANVPAGLWIWVDIRQKTLTLYEGTSVKDRWTIATGAWQTPTPIGVFTVTNRFAGELGGFGTRFLGLNVPWGQYGIHGTNKPETIGSNASHGCIRMRVRDAEALYALVGIGTKVVVDGGPYGLLGDGLRELSPGDCGSHVMAVQRRLTQLGYATLRADGIYGEATQRAVLKARKQLGLPQVDRVDASFYKAIGLIAFE